MIQQLIDGLFDGLGLDRMPVKRPRLKKPSNYPEYIQLSLFDILKPYAEKKLSDMYLLYQQYVKELNEIKKADSSLYFILIREYESRIKLIVDSISEFSFMWGLI